MASPDQTSDATNWRLAFSSGLPRRALLVAVVVGTLLTVINQVDAVLGAAAIQWPQAVLTYVVPFFVATLSGLAERRDQLRAEREGRAPPGVDPGLLRAPIDALGELSSQVHDNATQVNSASRDRAEFAEEVSRLARQKDEHSRAMLERITAGGRNVQEIRSSFEQYAGEIDDFISHIARSAHDAEHLRSEANLLFAELADVAGLADTITSLAEQTNLLALNASIEAARAGDVGRGFAVVAEEVKSLAMRSKASASDIYLTLDKLKGMEGRLVQAMEKLSAEIKASVGLTTEGRERTEARTARMHAAVDQLERSIIEVTVHAQAQLEQSNEVTKRVDTMTDGARAAIDGSARNIDVGRNLLQAVEELRALL